MSLITNPAHPGEVLKGLYLDPIEFSAGKLARHLGVPRTRIERLIKGQTGITTDTAARLAKFFGTSRQLWMNMQTNYDLANDDTDVSGIETLETA
ncbi:MAG: HigA family addiction module antitoxin [Pseudomonadota bacterium]